MLSEDWLRSIGPFPEKVPLQQSILEVMECGSFTRFKIRYCVEFDEYVHAYLCIPTGGSLRRGAVFCHHQHGGNWFFGKSELVGLAGSPDMALDSELAALGFVTLAPDLPCFGERSAGHDPAGANYFELARRLTNGRTLLATVIHEIQVGIDVLQMHSAVDRERIGFIGHSYGGRTAFFAAAHDDRIKATVSNCGSTTYRDMVRHGTGIQLEFVVPGISAVGDLNDLLRFIEPRSIMLLGATEDEWSIGLDEMVRLAQNDFVIGEIVGGTTPGAHAFSVSMRSLACAFLIKHYRFASVAGPSMHRINC